jgi:hypothetical protein
MTSTALAMIRKIVFSVGFAVLLSRFFGLDEVLYCVPVFDILTGVASVISITDTYKELNAKCI